MTNELGQIFDEGLTDSIGEDILEIEKELEESNIIAHKKDEERDNIRKQLEGLN